MSRSAYETARRQQARAADPTESQLAGANAGSGKTKVLVDRVCRILCLGAERKQGPDPGKILCLTYTKAAASEMQARLFKTLGDWSIFPEEKLNQALNELLGTDRKRGKKELSSARELFARALETPEGLKIQTIHSFCERVLARFPLEAGITPGYEALDEAEAAELQQTVQRDILQIAYENPDGELAQAIRRLAREMANQGFDSLINSLAVMGDKIDHWRQNGGIAELAKFLNLPEGATTISVQSEAWKSGPLEDIKYAAQILGRSDKVTDRRAAEKILAAFELPADQAFEQYRQVYFTNEDTLRASIVTKYAPQAAVDLFGSKDTLPTSESARMEAAFERVKSADCLELTRAIFTITDELSSRYALSKKRQRKLDFNDQIILIRNLLSRSEAADWIRYKLDYGIEHILIDEAQDTSPDQWAIIDALKDGFVEQDPDQLSDETAKTFFAVGDDKQSIFSFQGARPEIFRRKIREFYNADTNPEIRMEMSFRSSQEILDVVDQTFNGQTGLNRLFGETEDIKGAAPIQHKAHKERPGQVELWPLTRPPESAPEEKAWDTRPVDSQDQSSAQEKLASHIAQTIRDWIDDGASVNDRDDRGKEITRPVAPGDILILVKKRRAFFDALIRHLKLQNVPVAGADRLVLKDAVVVKDMLALTRFVLLPADDLSLAEVLRSPLIDLSEDHLFELAHSRGDTSLLQSLQSASFPAARRAADLIRRFRRSAARFAPYEFYARVLDETDHTGMSIRRRIYSRLGLEAEDALNAFLAQALAHQRRRSPSLLHFLRAFEHSQQDIKREMDRADGEVRVMTVHGAKGLQAPIVILPETSAERRKQDLPRLLPMQDGFVYLPTKLPANLEKIKGDALDRAKQEDMRLLYVAMTRAECRLVICGYHTGRKDGLGYAEDSWYAAIRTAMDDLPTTTTDCGLGEIRMYGALQSATSQGVPQEDIKTGLPDWINRRAPEEPERRRDLTPSDLLGNTLGPDMPLRSPAGQSPDRFQRGNIIHKLLEILPDIQPERRRVAAQAYLDKHLNLTSASRQTIADEVMAVLENPEFSRIFAPDSQAEVSLTGSVAALPGLVNLNAQIDRLAVYGDEVYIVDFKSNRPPPKSADNVPEIYWGQMAAYRAMVADIYPNHRVRCALLWTDGPRLMWLDDERLTATLTKIGELLT